MTIFVAKSWPAWQAKYINIVRETYDGVALNVGKVTEKIPKADMKKVMPFIQVLKRRLESGESENAVFERKLEFDEIEVLKELAPALKATIPKLKEVDILLVEEGAGSDKPNGLPKAGSSAEPGQPSFEFANL